PTEQPLDIGELELDIGRAAVVALAGAGRRLHRAQERIHLLRLQRPPEAHRMMAGEGREPLVKPARKTERAVFALEVGGEVTDECGEIALGDYRRRLANQDGAVP